VRSLLIRIVPDFTTSNPSGASQTWLNFGTQIRPDLDLGTSRFSDHRTIRLMKLMASTMLSAAIKRQYSSVLPLFSQCSPYFDEICRTAVSFVLYFLSG